jgi:hypothetical protein
MDDRSRGDAERRNDAGLSPFGRASGDHVEHVGAGRQIQRQGRRHEEQQGVAIEHVFVLTAAPLRRHEPCP